MVLGIIGRHGVFECHLSFFDMVRLQIRFHVICPEWSRTLVSYDLAAGISPAHGCQAMVANSEHQDGNRR